MNPVFLNGLGRDRRKNHVAKVRNKMQANLVILVPHVARAALPLRDDLVFALELIRRCAEGLAVFDFAGADFTF